MASSTRNAILEPRSSSELEHHNPYAVMKIPDAPPDWKPTSFEERVWQFICAVMMLGSIAVLFSSGLTILINGLLDSQSEWHILSGATILGSLLLSGSLIMAVVGFRALWHTLQVANSISVERSFDGSPSERIRGLTSPARQNNAQSIGRWFF